MNNNKHIFLLGATDRNNYGDLLFPHIVVEYFKKNATFDYKITNYALVKSNLTKIGGLRTKSYNDFLKDTKHKQNVSVILVGGEVLGADWLKLFSYLSRTVNFLLKHKLFEYRLLRRIVKFVIIPKNKRVFPYLLSKNELDNIQNLVYSGVGGSIPDYYQPKIKCDIFSVRTKKDLSYLDKIENLQIIPDSAILMSEFWPISKLELKVDELIKNTLPNNYIFFQINNEMGSSNVDEIVFQLTELYTKTNLPVILCPIGKAIGHEDHFALNRIHKKLKIPHLYFKRPDIWDIMYMIAKSKLFVGTSLHGVITAMSFAVPYLGVLRPNMKIQKYLDDWAIPELLKGASIMDIKERALEILEEKITSELILSADKMKRLANEFLLKVIKLVNNE